MDFRTQRIIFYGIGTMFIALWAVFGVLSYFVAMIMASGCLSIALILEAKEAHIHHRDLQYYIKMALSILIVILCIVLIMFEYSN